MNYFVTLSDKILVMCTIGIIENIVLSGVIGNIDAIFGMLIYRKDLITELFASRVFAADCVPPPDSSSNARSLKPRKRAPNLPSPWMHHGASDYQFTLMCLKSSGGLYLMDDL